MIETERVAFREKIGEAIETAEAAALDVATPDLHCRIILALKGETEEGEYHPVLIPKNLPAKPRRLKAKTSEGLLILDAEPIQPAGECPGGQYIYVNEVDRAVRLLRYWAARKAWAAVDLETGCSWRDGIDGKTGEKRRVYFSKGVDAYTACIFLCSVSVEPGRAVVFDMRTLMKEEAFNDAFREFLSECRLVAHNNQFEQSFFAAHFGITGNVVYDTMIVNQLMTAGRKGSSDLDGMMQRYLGIKLEKDFQKLFIRIHPMSPIPDGAVAYSAADVCQLLTLAQKVDTDLRQSPLVHIWDEIEQPLMRWIVEAKTHGICIDAKVFIKLSDEMDVRMKKVLGELAELCPTVQNINSHPQLKAWFHEQKLPLKSTNEETLAKVIKDYPDTVVGKVADLILEFRGYHKLKTSYAVPFLEEHPSAKTGRIHAWWKQTSTVTGRMACSPGLQTLPSKGEFVWIRNAIVAEKGHTLCWIDLSQFEVRGLAEMSGEPSMISSFIEQYDANEELDQYCLTHGLKFRGADVLGLADKANGKDAKAEKAKAKYAEIVAAHPQIAVFVEKLATLDFHKRTASVLFQKPVSEVTKDERTKAKVVTFAVPYGAGPPGIAEQAKITIEAATELLDEYYNKHPVVKQFLDKCKLQATKKGYTETPSGRRRYYDLPRLDQLVRKAKELKADPERLAEWEKLKVSYDWNRTNDPVEIAQKQCRAQLGAIEREGTNHPIQGLNADVTKLATVMAAPRLKALHEEIAIVMWVHDEIVLTAPTPLVNQAAAILKECMIAAGQRWLKKVPVEVSVSLGPCWGK
jgi:DNA polymerase I-like protein with 3'-5' exonuclease and polymerase domains